jgi:hypothetical protein
VNRLAANGTHTSAGAIFAGAAANEAPAAALILCASGGAATVGAPDARIGPVAQWSELAAHNRLVAGSSPAGPTNKNNELFDIFAGTRKRELDIWQLSWQQSANFALASKRPPWRPCTALPWAMAASGVCPTRFNLPPAPEPQFAESRRMLSDAMCHKQTRARITFGRVPR